MLDVGETQLLASLCRHAAPKLADDVRPRASVRDFAGFCIPPQVLKLEGLETVEFSTNGRRDPLGRIQLRNKDGSVRVAAMDDRGHIPSGRLRSTAVSSAVLGAALQPPPWHRLEARASCGWHYFSLMRL